MTTNRHMVKVTLVAKCTVEMEALAEDGDDPCDLTAEDEAILDRVWDQIGREDARKRRDATDRGAGSGPIARKPSGKGKARS